MQLQNLSLVTVFFLLFLVSFGHTTYSQVLQRNIQFHTDGDVSVKSMLDSVSTKNGFYFSYESKVLEMDKSLQISDFKGTLEEFLVTTLGDQYEYREIPGYIIIRYAPERLDLDAEIDSKARKVTVKGYVTNLNTQDAVKNASIFDKNSLTSTLTDDKGYFKISYKETGQSIWLTLKKENYRDTTFLLLPTVNIVADKEGRRFRFIPDDGSTDKLEESFVGRMFIGLGQRFQRINLGGFFAESPFQMSFVPGLSSRGLMTSQSINKFSLNVLGGYTAGVEGLEIAGIFNINQKNVKSVQVAGIFNVVGGSAEGLQVGGVYNSVFKNMYGLQIGGLHNHVAKNASGLQIAGLVNRTDSIAHSQIGGLVNHARSARGFQIAGLVNNVKVESNGLQLAGLANHASVSARVQIAGITNRAKTVSGFQLGLINFAGSSDYPIGLLNFIKDGEKSIGISIDESSISHFTFRSGGRKLYGLLGLTYKTEVADIPLGIEAGFGIHLIPEKQFSLDFEFANVVVSDFLEESNTIASFRLMPGFKLGKHFKLVGSPTLNFAVLDPGQGDYIKGWAFAERVNKNGEYKAYAGLYGGLQFVF